MIRAKRCKSLNRHVKNADIGAKLYAIRRPIHTGVDSRLEKESYVVRLITFISLSLRNWHIVSTRLCYNSGLYLV